MMKKVNMEDVVKDKITADERERISDLKLYLEQTDYLGYKQILDKIKKIKQNTQIIEELFDGKAVSFTKQECKELQKIITLQYEKKILEEHAIECLGSGLIIEKMKMFQSFTKYLEKKKNKK